ncbi:hypothetical protein DPMN_062836 [Dreissena polymorpha]|uniref:Uncharacterized protein n=1 Tax=Dreissena polymorpha TaxID=45954 RepID=A0A9D4C9E1_DREPO|nr:hypothetical protein DPMN_062836 [Dreissena polymorpha]
MLHRGKIGSITTFATAKCMLDYITIPAAPGRANEYVQHIIDKLDDGIYIQPYIGLYNVFAFMECITITVKKHIGRLPVKMLPICSFFAAFCHKQEHWMLGIHRTAKME